MACCREADQREMVSGVDGAGHKVGRSRRPPARASRFGHADLFPLSLVHTYTQSPRVRP